MDNLNVESSDANTIIDAPAHDEAYRFGRQPSARSPFPFTERQFARLLIVRGRIHASISVVACQGPA